MDNFSDKLIRLRKKNNYSMKEAAKLLDVPYTTYVGWEKGKTPNLEMLNKIATIFDVETSYFIKQDDFRNKAISKRLKIFNKIEKAMEEQELSLKDLAEKSTLSISFIEFLSKGHASSRYTNALVKISNALNIPFSDLIKDENDGIIFNVKNRIAAYNRILNSIGYIIKAKVDFDKLQADDVLLITDKKEAKKLYLKVFEIVLIFEPLLELTDKKATKLYDLILTSNLQNALETLFTLKSFEKN